MVETIAKRIRTQLLETVDIDESIYLEEQPQQRIGQIGFLRTNYM